MFSCDCKEYNENCLDCVNNAYMVRCIKSWRSDNSDKKKRNLLWYSGHSQDISVDEAISLHTVANDSK